MEKSNNLQELKHFVEQQFKNVVKKRKRKITNDRTVVTPILSVSLLLNIY